MDAQTAAKLLTDGSKFLASIKPAADAVDSVAGLVIGGVAASLRIVAAMISAGEDPVDHITRITAADELVSRAEKAWLLRYDELMHQTSGAEL